MMNFPGMDRRPGMVIAVAGGLLLVVVLATEVWIWVNLWPLRVTWGTALIWSLPQLYVWMLMAPAIVLLVRRWPIIGPNRGARLVFHVAASVAFSLLALALVDLSDRVIHWTTWLAAPQSLVADFSKTIIHLHLGIAVYWVSTGALHTARFYRQSREHSVRAAQLEAQLSRARLDTLKAQLQPHFLFNALNSIAVLMRHDPTVAEQTLQRLSDLLRAILDRADDALVSLDDELELVTQYLAIEEIRFADRLRVEVDVAPEARLAAVPNLLLQPLVENAVRHGIAAQRAPGTISIRGRTDGGDLRLVIRDTGPGLAEDGHDEATRGVGLSNTRRRLETLYGARHRFVLENHPDGGLEVAITIPYRKFEAHADADADPAVVRGGGASPWDRAGS